VPEYFGGSIPWLKTQELRDGWVYETEESLTEQGLANSSAKLLPRDTVMMAMYGATVGRLALLGCEMTCNQAACAMIVDPEKADHRFLYYLLLNDRRRIVDSANGAAQQNLSAGTIKALSYAFPPVAEQEGIAATLGALDDKIESNRYAQRILEDLGNALLESALEFDMYGFPAYDDIRRLGDVLSVLETGSRPKGGASADGAGMVSLGAESIQSAGVTTTEMFKTVPYDYAAAMRRGHLQDGDVLVYKDGGRPGNFIPHISAFGLGFPVPDAVINEHVYRVRTGYGISQGLLYWLLRSPWMDQEMRKRGTGVAIPGLNSSNFRDLPLPTMSAATVEMLSNQLSPMLDSLLECGTQNRKLAELRDRLLPELLSGRIQVAETEQAMAGAST
jgi:type I restriction enzyme S subunit